MILAMRSPRARADTAGLTIRRAHRRDAETVAVLIRESYRDVAERLGLTADTAPSHPSHCRAAWITRDLARGRRYFLLSRAGIPCGCVALRLTPGRVAYVERLAVLPTCRRQGLGRALLDYALREAAWVGKRQVRLGLIAGHADLIAWYRGRGFAFVRREAHTHLPFGIAVYGRRAAMKQEQ